jgi:hypothetical protein
MEDEPLGISQDLLEELLFGTESEQAAQQERSSQHEEEEGEQEE